MPTGSGSPKHENELVALDNSESSGSTTDLSLKSKSQTASTSVGASLDEKSTSGVSSSNESASGKLTDDGSGSDDCVSGEKNGSKNHPVILEHELEESEESKSPTPVESSKPAHLKYLPVQKLSTANMKKHDLELAQMGPLERENAKFASIGVPTAPDGLSSNTSEHKQSHPRSKRRKLKLPSITSALDRKFPLPNPRQIELYTQADDSVRLDPRPFYGKDNSNFTSTESGSESTSR